MRGEYELWLTDDAGHRLLLLSDLSFFSYSRTTRGMGTLEIGAPYNSIRSKINPVFVPDRRVEVWRSPKPGIPKRREGIYFLRKPRTYTRVDGVQMLVIYGRDTKDLLNRRWIIQAAGTTYTRQTDYLDDMMKAIVRTQMLYNHALDPDGVVSPSRAFPSGEFTVQTNKSLGPIVDYNFADRNVLDVLNELKNVSFQLHENNIANERIFFDVVATDVEELAEEILEEDLSESILDENDDPLLEEETITPLAAVAFRFETFAGLYGIDRTASTVFSVENENLDSPDHSIDHLDERNSVIVKGYGRGDSRPWEIVDSEGVNSSRWNRYETFLDASQEPDQDNLADFGYGELYANRPKETINAIFLNRDGSPTTPQSLYGVDWDLGDLLPVFYADRFLNVEVEIVYVAVDEAGQENILGRNNVNEG